MTQQNLSKAGNVKATPGGGGGAPTDHVSKAEKAKQRHTIAVAAAAEAAVATAHAAVEVARLTRPSYRPREHYAATVIQTAFRGYLVKTDRIMHMYRNRCFFFSTLALQIVKSHS